MYNANGSNILNLTEDYPLGYYDYYLNFDYVYEKTEFTNSEHADKLVINDRMIAHAIYVYTQL